MKKQASYFFILIVGILLGFLYVYSKPYRTFTVRTDFTDYHFCPSKTKHEIKHVHNSNFLSTNISVVEFQAILDSLEIAFPHKEKLIKITKSTDESDIPSLLALKALALKRNILCIEKMDSAQTESIITLSVLR